MVKLKNVIKNYEMGGNVVQALRDVSIEFRKNEFVSILGPSGCGKTTMLNIIGGLDRYSSGDLVVGTTSTRDFKDSDWDAYRNRTIGFVFQNYNLIAHQSVLDNVAIALTLSGVGMQERRERALKALTSVGIADQANKKPNQLSGGQMQRVAIARALVNEPKIILADEPTGALDTKTSKQIMEILKEVSKERLVIMVTHNAELAEEFSSRIIKLTDGQVTEDTNPIKPKNTDDDKTPTEIKKTSMSYFTALKLSFKNLLTKKARTILTAIAGSIGIIGVALVLALSSGMNSYIAEMQRSTLAGFPIQVSQFETSTLIEVEGRLVFDDTPPEDDGKVHANVDQSDITYHYNDFTEEFMESIDSIKDKTLAIVYDYGTQLNLLRKTGENSASRIAYSSDNSLLAMFLNSSGIMFQQTPGEDYISQHYQTVYSWEDAPSTLEEYQKLTLVVDSDYITENELLRTLFGSTLIKDGYEYEDFMGEQFKIAYNDDVIKTTGTQIPGVYEFQNTAALGAVYNGTNNIELYITRIIRINDDEPTDLLASGLAFNSSLLKMVREKETESAFTSNYKALTTYEKKVAVSGNAKITDSAWTNPEYPDITVSPVYTAISSMFAYDINKLELTPSEIGQMTLGTASQETMDKINKGLVNTAHVLEKAFAIDNSPSGVALYATNFETKDAIKAHLDNWNASHAEAEKILFTDLADMITSMVSSLINTIGIVLTAFAAVSLVVSTIMIGIITYVSVVERTKEIGILRSIGARKKDISRVFNAETMIIGFTSGVLGVLVTILLCIPINAIVASLVPVSNIAALPILSGVILIVISTALTLIGGLLPSSIAAKRDPVVALRTE